MTMQPLMFDSNGLPSSQDAYVVWLDVMGVRGWMLRSLHITANFIFKLHIAVLEEKQPGMTLYPVMDGVYVVSRDIYMMKTFLSNVFLRLANLFNYTDQHEHQFLVKGAIAFGPVIHGSDILAASSTTLAGSPQYRDSILMGMPMVFALQSEPLAPPFGIFVQDSAHQILTSQERKHSHCWWPWFCVGTKQEAHLLKQNIPKYFSWCEERAGAIDYDMNRIKIHKAQAEQYLVDA